MVTTMWARIENGTVAEITGLDPSGRFHKSLTWAACGEEVAPGWVFDGKGFAAPVEPAPTAEAQRSEVAAERYRRETAGIVVGGMPVDTDDRSKLLINGAALEAMIDPAYVMNWKTPNGFMQLEAEQVIAVARAVRAHVQACFDREAALLTAIEEGSYTPAMLAEGWP